MSETVSGILTFALIILIGLGLRHYIEVRRLRMEGLERFITCHGREKWGTRDLVARWRSEATIHIANELSKLQHNIWQIRHKIENLREMEDEARKKRAELDQSLTIANERQAKDLVLFIEFEIRESENKIADILQRIEQNEHKLEALRGVMIRKKACIEAYKTGKNPWLTLTKQIRGFFFSLK